MTQLRPEALVVTCRPNSFQLAQRRLTSGDTTTSALTIHPFRLAFPIIPYHLRLGVQPTFIPFATSHPGTLIVSLSVADKHGESPNLASFWVAISICILTFKTRVNSSLTWAAALEAMDAMTRIRRYVPTRFVYYTTSAETIFLSSEGQAQVRTSPTTYHSSWKEEAQGCRPKHCLQAPRYLPYIAMQAPISSHAACSRPPAVRRRVR